MIPKQCGKLDSIGGILKGEYVIFTPEKSSDSETNKMSHCKNTPKFLHFLLL